MGTWIKDPSYWNQNDLKIFFFFCKWLNEKHTIAVDVNTDESLKGCVGGEASSFSFLHQHWHFHVSVHRKNAGGAEHRTGSQEFYMTYLWGACVFCYINLRLYFLILHCLDLSFIPTSNQTPAENHSWAKHKKITVRHEWSQCINYEKSKETTRVRWSERKESIIQITRPISTFNPDKHTSLTHSTLWKHLDRVTNLGRLMYFFLPFSYTVDPWTTLGFGMLVLLIPHRQKYKYNQSWPFPATDQKEYDLKPVLCVFLSTYKVGCFPCITFYLHSSLAR